MHSVAVQLAPVLAAEKSKVPFYIAGGLLVLWALTVSLALGLRNPDFPGNLTGQRAVSAVTAVLVLAAVATAVLTSGAPAKSAPTPQAEKAPAPTATTPTQAGTTTQAGATATTQAATKLSLAADPGGLLKFDKKALSAKGGAVTISMTNMSPVEHNLTVASGSSVLGATPTFSGGTKTLTLSLKPGTYTFYCSVPGHRQAGMEGTLTVS